MFETRNYMIIDVSEVDLINFDQVLETSVDTLRFSADGIKTFFKYEGTVPDFVTTLTSVEGPYTHAEIIGILANEEWVIPIEEVEI